MFQSCDTLYIIIIYNILTCSFVCYRKKLSHEEIINNNIEDLVKGIEVKITTLWDRSIQLGLFTLSDVGYIKVRF